MVGEGEGGLGKMSTTMAGQRGKTWPIRPKAVP